MLREREVSTDAWQTHVEAPMPAGWRTGQLEFDNVGGRHVVIDFDGGSMTSDAGTLLLRPTGRAIGLIERVASCFVDHRSPELTVHGLATLIGQRIVSIGLGYEDINDHDDLRHDPVLSLLADRLEPKRADCAVLAGKSTLNRLEHAPAGSPGRHHKISYDPAKLEGLFVDLLLEAHPKPPKRIRAELREARAACRVSDQASRRFKDFAYRTRNSWARRRRVIGKA